MVYVLAPFRILAAVLALFVFGFLGIVLRLIGFNAHRVVMLIGHQLFARTILFISGVRLHVHGKENFHTEPAIYVSNHTSQMDIPAITAAFPFPLFFVAKHSLRSVPFLGWYMRAVGMIFVDRTNREKAMQSMRDAAEIIRSGKNVLTFPEGTRSPDGELKLFRRGSFVIAKEGGLAIVPVAVTGTFASLPKKSYVIRPSQVHVYIGKAILPESIKDKTVEQIAGLAQQAVADLKS